VELETTKIQEHTIATVLKLNGKIDGSFYI